MVCRITKVVKSYPCISEDLRPYCRQLHSIVPQKNGLKIFLTDHFYAPAFSRETNKTFKLRNKHAYLTQPRPSDISEKNWST